MRLSRGIEQMLMGLSPTPLSILNHSIPDNNVVAAWYRSDMGLTAGTVALVDGDMEAADASAWTLISTPTLTKEGNPKVGTRCLRITGPQYSGARQAVLTIGRTYRVTGWARGDGVGYPVLSDTGSARWIGTTSTDWQWFDVTFVAAGGSIALYQYGAGTRYVEWDALTAECLSVSAWADQSSNGRHLLQAVAASQPTLIANGTPNGRPVLRFDGVADYLKANAFTLNQPCQILLACKFTRQAAQSYLCDGNSAASCVVSHRSASAYHPQIYAGTSLYSSVALVDATWQIWDALANGASSGIAVNGAAYTTGNAGAGNPGGFTLAASASGSGQFALMDVSEVVIVSRSLTAAERAAITAYARGWSGC